MENDEPSLILGCVTASGSGLAQLAGPTNNRSHDAFMTLWTFVGTAEPLLRDADSACSRRALGKIVCHQFTELYFKYAKDP